MNCEFPDVQAGFRKGRETRNQIANMCLIIKKAREFQKNIYFCFIDSAKAFDCVNHNKLENSERDGNTRPPDLPPKKSACRSGSNSMLPATEICMQVRNWTWFVSISALLTLPKPLTMDHNKLWKILQEMEIPDHLTCLLRNLYAAQEATVCCLQQKSVCRSGRAGHGTTDWFQIGKGVCQGCILSLCLFNFYA